jgi:predicted nucleotidyltransferase
VNGKLARVQSHEFIEENAMTGKPRGYKRTLKTILAALADTKIRGVIIGAGALAAHGAPRYTADIDVLMTDSNARKLVMALFYRRGWKVPPPSRDVFLYTLESPAGVEVDVMGAVEPIYLDVIRRARRGLFMGESVLIPSAAHYVLLKLRAAEDSPEDRLKHLSDALKLLQTKPRTSLQDIRHYIQHHESDLSGVMVELERHFDRSKEPPASRRPRQ